MWKMKAGEEETIRSALVIEETRYVERNGCDGELIPEFLDE